MKKGKLRGKYYDMKDYRSTTKKKNLKSKVGVKYCDINGEMIRLYTSSKGPSCGLKKKANFYLYDIVIWYILFCFIQNVLWIERLIFI